MTRACSIDGCDRPHMAHGWCKRHWTRWWKYGIARPSLAKARRDLADATSALATYRMCADDRDAIGRVANAVEALTCALASVARIVERLTELAED